MGVHRMCVSIIQAIVGFQGIRWEVGGVVRG